MIYSLKNSKSFKITNGFLIINNSYLKIKYRKGKYALDVLKFFGSISLIALFLDKLKDYENIIGVYENAKFWFFALASVSLIYLFFEFIFRKKWINTLEINDLLKVEIGHNKREENIDEDSKIEITFYTNNGKQKSIELKKQHNQLNQFLEILQKRNTRIKIEQL
ncbi:hypothetical protein [Polaribacter sp. Hel_I_88]|uniref:hypothetical protein n=1 Tax=Polaribacter sp. Hel_I_88 TaxID=1250006 RepID=UPI0004795065|nr:hypothetical protein [Polaribacter sp. Hel_I_88]